MQTRELYRQKYEAQLKELGAKMEVMKAHAATLSAAGIRASGCVALNSRGINRHDEPPPPAPPPRVGAGSEDPSLPRHERNRQRVPRMTSLQPERSCAGRSRILTPCPHLWGRGRGWGLAKTA
jgi:hypothetical protein